MKKAVLFLVSFLSKDPSYTTFGKPAYIPYILNIKQKSYSAKELKLKRTKTTQRTLISPLIEGVNFEQTYNNIFFRNTSYEGPARYDLQKFLVFNYENLAGYKQCDSWNLSYFSFYYSVAQLFCVEAISMTQRKFTTSNTKEFFIQNLITLYGDKILGFTQENLEKLNPVELMFLQMNLDLTELNTEIIREEGNLYENINYFLKDEEYIYYFPTVFSSQKLAKDLNNAPKNQIIKNPLKRILENSDLDSYHKTTFEYSPEAHYATMCGFLGIHISEKCYFEGSFQLMCDDLKKLRRLNVNGIKIKNNSPKKYQRKYLEEFIVYKSIFSIYLHAHSCYKF